ncbi:MAG TPA: c-type cytochrome [Hyphomonadaceae bacterium]|nr:c-type cytochrome [Hyphomonadaceae bacterium]
MKALRPSATLVIAAFAAMAATACATTETASTPTAAATATVAKPAPAATPAPAMKVVEKPAAFAICGACHGSAPDAPPGLGPNLFAVAGKKAGTAHPDFDYSAALKNSGKTWTPENLSAFIQDPAKFIPDNNMDFPGLPDAAQAKAVADYMATLH